MSAAAAFSRRCAAFLYLIPATGGTPKVIVKPDAARSEEGCRFPCFLPDGRRLVYLASGSSPTVKLASLDSEENRVLFTDGSAPTYASPGWLLCMRGGVPAAQAFNADTLTLSGEVIPVGAAPGDEAGVARMSVSNTGVLVLHNNRLQDYQLNWFDRSGKQAGTLGGLVKTGTAATPELSPDGKQVVVQRIDLPTRNSDLWLIDVAKDTLTRLTTGPTFEQTPVWSADGSRVFYSSGGGARGPGGIYEISATGGEEKLLLERFGFPRAASPDGKSLIFTQRGEKTRLDIWMLPLAGGGQPFPILNSEFEETQPAISPDGRILAYVSDVAGRFDVFVRPMTPEGKVGKEIRISTQGGAQPRWKGDSKELYYVAGLTSSSDGEMMAVRVKEDTTGLDFEPATSLFKTHMLPNRFASDYVVTADGSRFLVGTLVGETRSPSVTIMMNWTGALEKH